MSSNGLTRQLSADELANAANLASRPCESTPSTNGAEVDEPRSREPSKALESEWIAIQESERDNNVVSVDCAAKPRLCDEYDVASYPAIRLFHGDGRVDRYRGARRSSAYAPLVPARPEHLR